MKSIKSVLIVKSVFMFAGLMMALATLIPQAARGQQWPGFRYDSKNTGRCPYNAPISDPVKKWEIELDDGIYGSPAIGADGTIYVPSDNGTLYALNPDKTEKWRTTIGTEIYSSPAIGADGTIYIGSDDNYLYALNPADGMEKWKVKTDDEVDAGPAIGSDGTIYFGSDDDYLYAVNPDGAVKWTCKTEGNIDYYLKPAIGDDGTIYIGSDDNHLYAVNPDDTVKWTCKTDDEVSSSPAIGSDGTIYFGSDDNHLYAVNPDDGTPKWKFETEGDIDSSPAIGCDGTIYFGSDDNYLYAVNPDDGTPKWKFETDDDVTSSPVIGADGTIYFGSDDDYLYALNPADGTEKWKFDTDDDVSSSPVIGSDGTIYIGSENHKFYAITGTIATAGYASAPVAPGGTIDFGSGTVGVAINQTFDVQEAGDANLTVDEAAAAITGTHAADFSIVSPAFPFTIANCGGADQTVTVACIPSAEGVRMATLNLTSNDPANAAVTYNLTCTVPVTPEPPPVPSVLNVTSTASSDSYSAGSVIVFTVHFSQSVWVKGMPLLVLNTGGPVPGTAYYSGGSGTEMLTFRYIVADGDDISDLDYWSEWALESDGGRIYSNQDIDAELDLAGPGEQGSVGYNTEAGVFGVMYPVYRFYRLDKKKHLFTTDEIEKDHLIKNAADVWQFEYIAYYAYRTEQYDNASRQLKSMLQAVHRFYSETLQTHLFTLDENEKEHLIANAADVWRYEGPAFYVPASELDGAVPVYRFYSESLKVHLFTVDENEKTHLVDTAGDVWRFEGVAYYAYP